MTVAVRMGEDFLWTDTELFERTSGSLFFLLNGWQWDDSSRSNKYRDFFKRMTQAVRRDREIFERWTEPFERLLILSERMTEAVQTDANFCCTDDSSRSNGSRDFLNGCVQPFERMLIFSERMTKAVWTDANLFWTADKRLSVQKRKPLALRYLITQRSQDTQLCEY